METSTKGQGFVEWKEEFVSQEKGNRVVHYYLKDSVGDSVLAVVGTERSLRHMVYVVSDEFLKVYGSGKSNNACYKWRSRREVVNWLTSSLSKKRSWQECSTNDSAQSFGSYPSTTVSHVSGNLHNHPRHFARKLKGHNSDIIWSGVSWACAKQLEHYQAFSRNGTTIPVHSFVLVMAKEEKHYLAYLEDMYGDKKGQKKVKVRWFHQNQEVVGRIRIPSPAPHSKEVFITPYAQVISAECVDGLATILTLQHYEKCLTVLPYTSFSTIYLCFRQLCNNRVKPFNLSKLEGYFDQIILSVLDPFHISNQKTGEEDEEYCPEESTKKGKKRSKNCKARQRFGITQSSVEISCRATKITSCGPDYQNLRFGLLGRRPLAIKYIKSHQWVLPPFKVDEKIELLCQDSGIRGCWFRCSVLEISQKQIKVQYDDVLNEDGCNNLEEWVPAFRVAASDKLGMRCRGRLTVRPCPPHEKLSDSVIFPIGTSVDAWWSDGWWEGVVTGVENFANNSLQVYFPGEQIFCIIERRNLRISRDWFENHWTEIEAKLDIVAAISAVSPGTKFSTSSIVPKGAESGGSAISGREAHAPERGCVEEEKNILLSGLADDGKGVDSMKQPLAEDKNGKGDDDDTYADHANCNVDNVDEVGQDGDADNHQDQANCNDGCVSTAGVSRTMV